MIVLRTFKIENFRAFSKLELADLGRVNLITGQNNVGKTTLLEALAVFARAGLPSDLANLLAVRDDVLHRGASDAVVALFHAFRDTAPIQLEAEGGRCIAIQRGWATRPRAAGSTGPWRITSSPDPVDESQRVLVVQVDGEQRFYRSDVEAMEKPNVSWRQLIPATLMLFADGLDPDEAAALWHQTAGFDREEQVVRALQIVEPRIRKVLFVRGPEPKSNGRQDVQDRQEFYCRIRLEGMSDPVPIRSLDDGMRRLLDMSLAMVNCSGGMLLIDEFENGIHFSAQGRLWRFLFELAAALDVQVFATTHSWDAVQAFQAAASASPEEGRLIRLARHGLEIRASVFSEADLALVTRQHLEVR